MSLTASFVGKADPLAGFQLLPMFTSAVRAGFPSPADDHLDTELDLHSYSEAPSSYLLRACRGRLYDW
ncbi:hypothetical protein HAALTHF_05190n [Vreelandella aquamarina]|nr:hypothetical protein HAALTHF_05190n [Halomonas axialensis]